MVHVSPPTPKAGPAKKLKTDANTDTAAVEPYGPHSCAELKAYETKHVGHPHNFNLYQDALYLRPNHINPLILNKLIKVVKAQKIAHNDRGMTDLSNAACYGTTHRQPYPLQGAYVVYRLAFPYEQSIHTMYWCSKCASRNGMRGAKKESDTAYRENDKSVVLK